MTLDSLATVFYTLTFIVPGFIAATVYSVFTTRQEDQSPSVILKYLALSAVNFALWSWAIYLLLITGWLSGYPWLAAGAWFWITLASPAIVGLVMGRWAQKETWRRVLQRLGFFPVHVIPTAWDWHFGRTRDAKWVLVTLKNGATVAGFYGNNSFASSSLVERDIYLEQVMHLDGGTWSREAEGKSVLVAGSEIRTIEFWPVTYDGDANDRGQESHPTT